MSRGIGSLQRAVLDHLRGEEHGADSAYSIAYGIALRRRGLDPELDDLPGRLPHAEQVAARRAIHGLRRRGLVRTWYEEPRRVFNDHQRPSLFCGLAGLPPPPLATGFTRRIEPATAAAP